MNTSQRIASKEQRVREISEDLLIINKARSGGPVERAAAFRQLVDRHHRRAFVIALGLVRDEADAQEVVQDAFIKVYKNLDSFEGNSTFFTWLYRIVTNLSIDLMRKPGRAIAEFNEGRQPNDDIEETLTLVPRMEGTDPVEMFERKEIASKIDAALESLPAYHRSVIVMREVEGMSYEEMSQAMGVSKGTIMSRLYHARRKMQQVLADCYADQAYVDRGAARDAAEEDSQEVREEDDL